MGLDSVELMLEVEDEFKIRLSDPECEGVRTVADLVALVMAHLPRSGLACPTARHFRLLRARAEDWAGVSKREFRPRASLEAVFPRSGRRRRWAALGKGGLWVPRLVAPRAVHRGFVFAILGVMSVWVVVGAVLLVGQGGAGSMGLLALALVLVGGCLVFAYERCRVCFPAGCETVGDLVRRSMPPVVPSAAGERMVAERAVLERVRWLTARQLGIPIERVQAESRFVEDLEID